MQQTQQHAKPADTKLKNQMPEPPQPQTHSNSNTIDKRVDQAQKLLEEASGEEKFGMHLNMNKPAGLPDNSRQAAGKKDVKKESSISDDYNDNEYQDDFDDIEEDLPVDEVQPEDIHVGITASGQGITVS